MRAAARNLCSVTLMINARVSAALTSCRAWYGFAGPSSYQGCITCRCVHAHALRHFFLQISLRAHCEAENCNKSATHGVRLSAEERRLAWVAAGGSPGPATRFCAAHAPEGMARGSKLFCPPLDHNAPAVDATDSGCFEFRKLSQVLAALLRAARLSHRLAIQAARQSAAGRIRWMGWCAYSHTMFARASHSVCKCK